MKPHQQLSVALCILVSQSIGFSQGSFQNLDFEGANLPSVPVGEYVSSLTAIPSWIPYYSTNESPVVWHNNYALAAVNISIIGPGFADPGYFQPIQGNYSIILQSGLYASPIPPYPYSQASASVAQTGMIPQDARSVRFYVKLLGGNLNALGVSVGGQAVPLVGIMSFPGYYLYGADVSGFAGQMQELRISSFPTGVLPYNHFGIDNIFFSDLPIPEPGAFGLFGLGTLMFVLRFRSR